MATSTSGPAALADVRVLDLTTLGGQYAAKLLADLGADVVKVEPPAGSPARNQPPFADDEPSPNRSLAFWYWNTSKRSLTLDLHTEDGRDLFRMLVPRFDVVMHSYRPAQAAPLGLAPDDLRTLNPKVITCAVTPYGDSGPHADYEGDNLTVSAMSGVTTLFGFPDRAPTMPPGEQAAVCGGIVAAQGIILALLVRDTSGQGQHVEVSMQEAMSIAQETAMQSWDMRQEVRKRTGGAKMLPGVGTYATADGHVYCMVGVPGFGAPASVLVEWMASEGMAGDLQEEPWRSQLGSVNLRELTAAFSQPEKLAELMVKFRHIDEVFMAFFQTKPKQELYVEGQRRRLLIGPVNSVADLTENDQLAARAWWQDVEHPELGRTVRYPGPPFHHSVTPWRISRRPPLVGEHTAEILQGELGLSAADLEVLMGAGAI